MCFRLISRQKAQTGIKAVSYTHLDVYKRQLRDRPSGMAVLTNRSQLILCMIIRDWIITGFAMDWILCPGTIILPGIRGRNMRLL